MKRDSLGDQRRRSGWWWANDAVFSHAAHVRPQGLLVYFALCRCANGAGVAWPAIPKLVAMTGLSRSTVKRSVPLLVEAGLISCQPRRDDAGDPTSNAYTILDVTEVGVGSFGTDPSSVGTDGRFGVDRRVGPERPPKDNTGVRTTSEGLERARRTRLPPDLVLTDELKAIAVRHKVAKPDHEFAKFSAHYQANGVAKLDWGKAWLSWCLKSGEFTAPNGNGYRERFQATPVIPSIEQTRRDNLRRIRGES